MLVQREKSKYLKMNRSTKRFVFFYRIIYFFLTYVYVSSLLLLSEKICDTRPYDWNKNISLKTRMMVSTLVNKVKFNTEIS